MKVKSVIPGAVIRDPETKRLLPDEGGEVPESNFWVRRLLAGEVERIDPPTRLPGGLERLVPPAALVGKVEHVDPPIALEAPTPRPTLPPTTIHGQE